MNYTKMAQRTAKMITKYGASVSIIHHHPGTFDPIHGTYTGGYTITCSGHAVIKNPYRADMGDKWIDGTLIMAHDREAIIATGATITPAIGDHITLGTANYAIQAVKPLEPALITLFYDVLLRK